MGRLPVLIVAGMFCFCLLVIAVLLSERYGIIEDSGLIIGRFPALVGLPMIAGLSFLVVLLLPQAYGRIEFKVWGLTFKGAAGPTVLWLLCFFVISMTLKLFY